MPAVAMTDHGNVFGAYEFYTKAKAAGVKPIIGIEAYFTPNISRFERKGVNFYGGGPDDVSARGAYTHMTLLSESTEGMHNLFRLSTGAWRDGFFKQPRVDRELLAQHAKGLIGTTGCPSGEVQVHLRHGNYDAARQAAARLPGHPRPGQLLPRADGPRPPHRDPGPRRAAQAGQGPADPAAGHQRLPLRHAGGRAEPGAPALHQLRLDDGHPRRRRARASGSRSPATGYYLKSAAEMREIWRDLPEACDNTLLIAERCDVEFTEGNGTYMPRFPCPEGHTEETWLIEEVERGLARRYPDGVTAEVRERTDFEIGVILKMGFPGYFLVVADFINWAKQQGIRVGPGRGSGAGSIVAYALRITDLDPLRHGLLFERFLNPERISMPDFDIDFDERRRGEVIRYVTEKYGDDRVAMIVTYGTIKAKQAVKDSSRILGYPFAMGDRVTKAMPAAVMGKDVPLKEIFNPEHKRYGEGGEFRGLYDNDADVKRVVDTALGIEGLKRQWGVHAAGVIMSSEPLVDVIPLLRRPADGVMITQFDYPTCESLGLIKMDFLGLRNLTVLDDCLHNIEVNRGEKLVLEDLDLDDAESYQLLGTGNTLGVFQLDGGPMRSLLRLMRPDSFEDISAVLALYRPGPMGVDSHTNYALRKNGKQAIDPIHPELAEPLAEILEPTYGLIVYQEQILAVAQKVAGYTLGQADLLRKAMGKKKKEILDAEYGPFSEGMKANGYSDRGDQGAVGHAGPVLRLRLQQGPHRGLRPDLLLDRLPQAALRARIHGRPAHLGQGRQGQVRDLPQRVPPDEDPGAAAGRQRVLRQLHPGRQRHPVRPHRDPQRRRQRRRRIVAAP